MSEIYLRQGTEFVRMRETPYDTEAVLQELIGKHPQMLAGDAADAGQPGAASWLLVRREAAVLDEDDLASRGSLDHLFLDGTGVPTLVEVKRSSDARIRREVVGQMLDYAANASHWSVDRVRGWLEDRCRQDGLDLATVLTDHVDDAEAFWEQVRTNLAAGRLRLVFVADVVPAALRRIVEFLNEQMTECEVIAIEVKQYVDEARRQQTIVPRVLGQTEAARRVKGQRRWDRDTILARVANRSFEDRAVLQEIFAWADARGDLDYFFGSGKQDGSFAPGLKDRDRAIYPIVVYTYGRIEINFQSLCRRHPFSDDALRAELRDRLNQIDGVAIPADALQRRPSIPLEALRDPLSLKRFLAVVDWALQQPGTSDERMAG